MKRALRFLFRLGLTALGVYVGFVVLAVGLDAWSNSAEEPLPAAPVEAIPSGRAGAVVSPVDPPPPSAPFAPAPSTLPDSAVRFMQRQPGGEGRMPEEEKFREYATLAEDVTRRSLDLDVDAEILLAISFRESSWDPTAEGDAGEIGLMQLHYRNDHAILEGFTVDAVKRSPALQLYLGMHRYERALDACHGEPFAALLQYASGRCDGPLDPDKKERAVWSANRVLSWAESMRRDR